MSFLIHHGDALSVLRTMPDESVNWYVRDIIVWHKPAPMPESVRDRCTKAWEPILMLAKSERYFWDQQAIAEPLTTDPRENYPARAHITGRGDQGFSAARGNDRDKSGGFPISGQTRNKRNVWTLPPMATPEAHFATFPLELPETCLLAGCPPGGTVLDPFAGAGTTGLACLKHGRRFVGIELNANYIEIAHSRARKYYPLFVTAS